MSPMRDSGAACAGAQGHAAARERRRGRAGRRAAAAGALAASGGAGGRALLRAGVTGGPAGATSARMALRVHSAPHEHLAAQQLREPAAPHAQHCVAAGVWRRCRGVGGSHAAAPCMRRLVCGHRGLAALPRRRRLRRRRLACSRCMHAAARMRPLHAVGGARQCMRHSTAARPVSFAEGTSSTLWGVFVLCSCSRVPSACIRQGVLRLLLQNCMRAEPHAQSGAIQLQTTS